MTATGKKFGLISIALLIISVGVVYWLTMGEQPRARLDFVSTIAGHDGQFGEPFGIAIKGNETYVSDGEAGKIFKISAEGVISEFASGLETPSGIAFDAAGDLLVADSGSHTIKAISPAGEMRTLAGVAGQSGSIDTDAATSLFNAPVGIAAGTDGKVFVSDTYNDRIRVIEKGRVTTLAGSKRGFRDGSDSLFDTPLGLAIWKGRLLVADSGNKRIRAIEPDGSVWTLVGNGESDLRDGLLSFSAFVEPTAITVDAKDNIYIADGNAVRRIGGTTFPTVTTLAGGQRGFQNGNTHKARFNRISGLAFSSRGDLFATDSENRIVRELSNNELRLRSGRKSSPKGTPQPVTAEEFRKLQPPRWPYDPPTAKRDIAGTLGEIRGEIIDANSQVWFHNGLDIAGAYGETARFVRNEKVLDPNSAENFATLRELLRLPTMGYIHLRLGRDKDDKKFGDARFVFTNDESGKLAGVRVPRGSKFAAGEPVGTLNAMNHVHLIAGRSGAEMNALAALELPGISDSIAPVIESVTVFDENWSPIETKTSDSRMKLQGKYRIIVRAFDRMDGNPERRRLGVYKIGIAAFPEGSRSEPEPEWKIIFDRMPSNDLVKIAYGKGSHSGATGETIFNYIVTNRINDQGHAEGVFDTAELAAGNYTIKLFASDYFGNISNKQIPIEVTK